MLLRVSCDGRKLEVNPDVIGDFRNMQFSNDEFCFFPIQMTNIKE